MCYDENMDYPRNRYNNLIPTKSDIHALVSLSFLFMIFWLIFEIVLLCITFIDSPDMTFVQVRDAQMSFVPLVENTLGWWIMQSYLFLVVVLAFIPMIRSPQVTSQTWIRAVSVLLRLMGRILEVWRHIIVMSCYYARMFLHTDPLKLSLRDGPPRHLAIGWTPSIDPQIE